MLGFDPILAAVAGVQFFSSELASILEAVADQGQKWIQHPQNLVTLPPVIYKW